MWMHWTWQLRHEVGRRNQPLIPGPCWFSNSIQTNRVKAQVDLVHGMLGDIHEWYLSNIKDAPKGPKRSSAVDSETTKLRSGPDQEPKESELTFSVFLDLSSETSSRLLCPKATFNPEWLHTQGSHLFRCVCGNHDDLECTCKIQTDPWYTKACPRLIWRNAVLPVSLLVHLTTARPTWNIHIFSKAYNSVLSLLISNVPSTRRFRPPTLAMNCPVLITWRPCWVRAMCCPTLVDTRPAVLVHWSQFYAHVYFRTRRQSGVSFRFEHNGVSFLRRCVPQYSHFRPQVTQLAFDKTSEA